MFETITKNFGGIMNRLRGIKHITEKDFNETLRSIRISLLESDVSLPIVKSFIEKIKEKAIGQEIIKNVSSGQMVIKIINDELISLLGDGSFDINFDEHKPMLLMMIGLQGQGKTSASVKLANRIKVKNNKKVLLVSLDVYRPAAQEQLKVMADQIAIDSLEIIDGQEPIDIAKRGVEFGKNNDYDVIIFDTAGRLTIDEDTMIELHKLVETIVPHEKLLVADSLMGQDAVNIAKEFNINIGLTGIILTRIDADGKAGAALSMKVATGCPIRYISSGEKVSDFDVFHPERIISRILDMGDIVSFVEKAQEVVDDKEAEELEKRIKNGDFDFNDFLMQLKNLKKLGGLGSILGFLPGANKLKDFMKNKGFDDNVLKKQESIVLSMTKFERIHPDMLNSSRKFRIARGSGTSIQDVNSLLKKFKEIKKTVGAVGKMDKSQLKNIVEQIGNIRGTNLDLE
ncbi:MAG: signal recognition particle protein [Rickettsiales bacterium]|jgi:signal recognition particle subunit SRP54|nr:signal recognition particle protein [Rickettsiales bacterium]